MDLDISPSLSIPDPPGTRTDSVDLDADVNSTVTLTCRSAGPGAFSTVWLRRGRRVGADEEMTINNVQVLLPSGIFSCERLLSG